MNLNLEGFRHWSKSNLKTGEVVNYNAYMNDDKDRLVIFPNASAMIENFNANIKELGGNGTWEVSSVFIEKNLKAENEWKFGKEFPTGEKTNKALELGTTAEKFLHRIDAAKDELYSKFPELHELEQIAVTKRRRRKFTEDGEELDIDRYMSGDPAMFSTMPRQDVRRKTASIYIDISCSAGTDSATITTNFIYSLAILDIIEKAGITTEIIIGASATEVSEETKVNCVACVAKEANEPLDILRLLSFCLPGMFRQYIFGCKAAITNGEVCGSLGYSVRDFSKHPKFFQIFNADIKVKGGDGAFRDNQVKLIIAGVKSLFNMSAAN